MTKAKFIPFTVALVGAFALAGCASQPARYVDPSGSETVVSVNKVDIQDFNNATQALVADMLNWDAFSGAKKPRVALSRVVNDTTNNFDTALLTETVQEAILKSGKATISMSMSVDRGDDVVAQEIASIGESAPVNVPDLTLVGKISEVATSAGKMKQVTYRFTMRLVDAKTRDVVWIGTKDFTKQGEKNSVGW